jgi:hypothetical protein
MNLTLGRVKAKGPVRVITPCWTLLRAGLWDLCSQALGPSLSAGGLPDWLVGEQAAADGDDDRALRELQDFVTRVPPGDNQYGLAIDALVLQFERRGDLPAAVEVLRRLNGVHRMVYPRSGVHGFTWLVARTHLLDLERQLGRTDRVAALVQELEGWVALADPDFVVRSALR